MPFSLLLLWLLDLGVAGWLFFPIARRIFGDALPDGGLAAGRILFLACWTLSAFWAGNLGVPTKISAAFYGVWALLGLIFWWRDWPAIRELWRQRKRAILGVEAIFLVAFVLFFLLRGFWSDTSGTNGEKGMDAALIAACARADYLPPPNPYAAGARLQSYYYFGHLQTALLTDFCGTTVRWSYNLMCATLPALCFAGLFALAAGLCKSLKRGLAATLLILCCGTLQPLFQWHEQWQTGVWPARFLRLDFFAVSRVIPFTINEFPFFTFNQADLHAHYFAFPLALAAISLGYAIFRSEKPARSLWLAVPLILAAQILTNTWDFPAYALLFLATLAFSQSPLSKSKSRLFALWLFLIFAAVLLAAPYLLALKSAARPPQLLHQPASPLLPWLALWGPIGLAWILFLWKQTTQRRLWFWLVPSVIAFPFYPVLALIFGLLIWTIFAAIQLRETPRFLCAMALCGLLALLWSETTWAGFLGDPNNPLANDFKRQDTVFKFGLQTWFLWGGAATCGALLTFKQWPILWRFAFIPALAIMFLSSVAVVFGRTQGFKMRQYWDAWAHLPPPELQAAIWLQNHARDGQNILEAEQEQGGDYSIYTRFAHATGIPTVIGPKSHAFQWAPAHSGKAELEWQNVYQRKTDARWLYLANDSPEWRSLLKHYKVQWIVIGNLERAEYGEAAMQSLEKRLPVVFQAGDATDDHRVKILSHR